MHILTIVDSEFPPVGGLNVRMVELARALVERGHKTTIVSIGKKATEEFEEIEVIHVPQGKKSGGLEQINRLKYSIDVAREIKKRDLKFDYVVGWNFFPNLAAYILKRIYGAPHICDMTDFGFDFFKAANSGLFWKAPIKILERLECETMPQNAKHVVCVSPFMQQQLTIRYRIPQKKIAVFPDGVDPNISPTKDIATIKNELGLSDEKVIVFLGNMDYHDGVDILLNSFKQIRDTEDVKLLFVGGGRKYYWEFRKSIEKSALARDVIFTGYVPREEAINYVSIANVGVIPFRKRLATNAVYTLKFFEYAALNVPVICTTVETLSTIVKEKNVGLVIPPENSKALANAIREILKGKHEFELGATNFKEYHWENIMEKYCELLESFSF